MAASGRTRKGRKRSPAFASSVVLAGGQSRRFGYDKALLRLGFETLLERTISKLLTVTRETVVVGPRAGLVFPTRVRAVADELPGAGPLAALLTGLRACQYPLALVVSCDLPFLNPVLMAYLLHVARHFDAVVPQVGGRLEPLHAVYSKKCIPALSALVESGARDAVRLVESGAQDNVKVVPEEELRAVDPGLLSFFNLNTQDDLLRARRILSGAGKEADEAEVGLTGSGPQQG